MITGDFNGDQRTDVLGITNSGTLIVALAGINEFVVETWGEFGDGFVDYVAGDFDGDGKFDVTGLHQSGNVWRATSDGASFQLKRTNGLASMVSRDWRNMMAGDFNGDSIDDFIIQDNRGNWFIGDGGTDKFTVHFANRWNPDAFAEFFVADLSGDGRDDLLARTHTNAFVCNESLVSGRMFVRYFGKLSEDPHAFAFGDFTGDRRIEMAALNLNTGAWTLMSPSELLRATIRPFGIWTSFQPTATWAGRLD
ncbi:MAG: VCBS repeat-containing protein [Planctomycetaceae bacterium]|nr:VCBS repeat-containing protein [Planctomycetaceae bacterium]